MSGPKNNMKSLDDALSMLNALRDDLSPEAPSQSPSPAGTKPPPLKQKSTSTVELSPVELRTHSATVEAATSPTSPTVAVAPKDADSVDFWSEYLMTPSHAGSATSEADERALLRRATSGLPPTMRGALWLKWLSSSTRRPRHHHHAPAPSDLHATYDRLLVDESHHAKSIRHDLARTFATPSREALYNVLKVYSLYDLEVGYCQGLSFVVGTALHTGISEEHCFRVLQFLMHTCGLRRMYIPGMPLAASLLYAWERLVSEQLPAVHRHFSALGVHPSMYASQWWLCLFAYRLPHDIVLRVWDVMLARAVFGGGAHEERSGGGGMMERVFGAWSSGSRETLNSTTVSDDGDQGTATHDDDVSADVLVTLLATGLSLLKKNQPTLLALEFEPLLAFLKGGMFEVYLGGGQKNSEWTKDTPVEKQALDALIQDVVGVKLTKRKLTGWLKEFRAAKSPTSSDAPPPATSPNLTSPTASLDLLSENARLQAELKKMQTLMDGLNTDHVQMINELVQARLAVERERERADRAEGELNKLKMKPLADE